MFLNYFFEIIKTNPSHTAITWGDDAQECSYAELNDLSNQMANYLKEKLLLQELKDQVVTICCDRTQPDWIICILAIWKLGGAVLLIDKNLSEQGIQNRINNAGSKIIITDLNFLEKDAEKKIFLINEIKSQVKNCLKKFINKIVDENDTAYIAYTSGTTGKAKAIALPHKGIWPVIEAHKSKMDIKKTDRVLQFSSFSFDACWMEFFMLALGVTLVLPNKVEGFLLELPDFIRRKKITIAIFVPAILRVTPSENLPSLRTILSTGESGIKDLFERWRKIDKNNLRRIFNGYGPSEVTVGVTIKEYLGGDIALGEAIEGSKIYLVDEEEFKQKGKIIVHKKKGIIAISGPGLAKCYLQDAKKTNECFFEIDDPNEKGKKDRIYLTGDIAEYDQKGQLIFKGRSDRQFKIEGVRIEGSIIEEKLCEILKNKIKGFDKVFVLPLHQKWKEETYVAALIAVIQVKSKIKVEITVKALREKLFKENLPNVAIPKRFYIVDEDFIVRYEKELVTPKGSISYSSFEEKIQDENFTKEMELLEADARGEESKNYILTEIEKELLELWKEILLIRNSETIDPLKTVFSEFGGTSLDFLVLILKLNEKYKVDLSLPPVIESQKMTLNYLAQDVVRRIVYQYGWKVIREFENNKNKLFLIHPVSGDTSEFQKLLNVKINIYGLKAPLGINIANEKNAEIYSALTAYQERFFCKSIETIATYAFYGIKSQQVHGPYYVGGYSFGGIVALEMARQLINQREDLRYVALLDPPPPNFLRRQLENSNYGLQIVSEVLDVIAKKLLIDKGLLDELASFCLAVQKNLEPQQKIKLLFECLVEFLQKQKNNNPSEKIKSNLINAVRIFKVVESNVIAMLPYELKEKLPHEKFQHFMTKDSFGSKKDWSSFFSARESMRIIEFNKVPHMQLLENKDLVGKINSALEEVFEGEVSQANYQMLRNRWIATTAKNQNLQNSNKRVSELVSTFSPLFADSTIYTCGITFYICCLLFSVYGFYIIFMPDEDEERLVLERLGQSVREKSDIMGVIVVAWLCMSVVLGVTNKVLAVNVQSDLEKAKNEEIEEKNYDLNNVDSVPRPRGP